MKVLLLTFEKFVALLLLAEVFSQRVFPILIKGKILGKNLFEINNHVIPSKSTYIQNYTINYNNPFKIEYTPEKNGGNEEFLRG